MKVPVTQKEFWTSQKLSKWKFLQQTRRPRVQLNWVKLVDNSVTKFGQFGKILKAFGQFFWMVYLIFGRLLYQLWHFYVNGQIVIVVNRQRLKNNTAIWSHCSIIKITSLLFPSYALFYNQCDQIGRFFGLWATFEAFGNN